jgi:hypothetical protein
MNHSGKYGEALWKAYLETKGYDVEDAPNYKFYDWDLRATKREADQDTNFQPVYTFEVKYDEKAYWWANKRGTPDNPNLYIEYRNTNRNEDSGILMSKADFYVYIIKAQTDIAYLFNTYKLRTHLTSASYKSVGNSATGDDNAMGWIPPLAVLMQTNSFIKQIELYAFT